MVSWTKKKPQTKTDKLDKQSKRENQERWAEGWEITGKGRRDADGAGLGIARKEKGMGGHRGQGAWEVGGKEDAGLGQCSLGRPTDTGEVSDR